MKEKQLSLQFIADLFEEGTEKDIVKCLFEEDDENEMIKRLIKLNAAKGKKND